MYFSIRSSLIVLIIVIVLIVIISIVVIFLKVIMYPFLTVLFYILFKGKVRLSIMPCWPKLESTITVVITLNLVQRVESSFVYQSLV